MKYHIIKAYFRNLGQHSILVLKGPILKKGHQKSPLYSILLPSVLHQNKVLYNFCKRWQRSIVKCNIGLEYALNIWLFSVSSTFFQNLQMFIEPLFVVTFIPMAYQMLSGCSRGDLATTFDQIYKLLLKNQISGRVGIK